MSVQEQSRGASGAPSGRPSAPPPLPDVSGLDLRGLRDSEAPALTAAVDHVLRGPVQFTGAWWGSDGGEGGKAHGAHCTG